MPWNEIKLNISANMDFGDAKQQISTIKQGIDGLKTSISEMPNVSKILDNSFERSATVVDALNDKLDRLEHRKYSSDEERLSLERGANNNILELNALRDVQLGTTSYSAQMAKQWFGDLPSAVQHQFDTIAPQLTAIIRSRMSSLSKAGSTILSKDVGQIASELTGGASPTKMDPAIRSLLNRHGISPNTDTEFKYLDQMISYLIPTVTPTNMNKVYQKARYKNIRQNVSAGLYDGKPEDLFPESFKETFRSQGKAFQTFDKAYQSMVLDSSYRKQLDNILKSNPVAVKAALASGISRRDERGVLETKDEITRSEWEGFRKALYDDLLVRVSGYKGNAIDAYKATGSNKKTLMQRLTSSTSGRAMLAMQDIEDMEDTRAWTNAANPGTWSKLRGEGKRIQDQLVVAKYSPFTGDKVALGDPRSVMISESHNTRLLGGGNWKNNQDVSDTIRFVSLAGYDAKNPEHQRFLENLFNPNGAQLGNAKFIAQSIHGTGQDTIVRMIEQEAFNRVNEQEAQWIKNHPDEAVRGIRGTYWRGFDDAEIDRLIQNGIGGKDGITAQKYGKHLEMLNKAWTNTSDLGINIDGKRFAVVDTSRLKDQLGGVSPGDGGAFFASSVMPHSGQFRGGIGLKGSAFVFEGNDLKAFGKKTGLLDEQGRLMMPGPNGELFDISGYQGFIPLDVVKNQGVLKDENGNYVSGDIASRRFTALLQRHPMSYHADYDLDQVASDNLGTQMSSFMMFSPELRQHQIDMAMRRMQELDTEEGQLKYVFGNKDDYLSRKVNPLFGGNSQLLASTEARSRIDNARASIYNDLIAGKYINFDNDDKIANLRAAASPLATLLLSKDGTIPDATIAKARSFLDKDANARLSDQDIRDMIILPKDKVIDFNRKDEPNVAVVRSPTGYGNMYYATNLAKDAEPIYKGFGISTTSGMYVSERDREKLQGMDFDADQVKAIYDRQLAEAVQSSLKQMGEYKPSDVKPEDIVYTPEQLKSWSIQNRLQAERSLYATMPMGTGSSGIRIMQVDYSRPENQALVYAAQRMAGIYDIGSTPKKAQTYSLEKDDPVWAALGLGKEYTKFSEKRTDLFKFDEGMIVSPTSKGAVYAGNGTYINPNHPDIYKASNGQYVNLRALRDMGVDEINLPSRYMANHMMAISTANRLYRTGNVDPTQMDAIYEAMNEKLGYGDAGPERTKLMQTMRMLQHQFGTGERAYITNDEGQYIQGLINSAAAELTLSAADYFDPTKGKYILGDREYDTKEQWAKAQEARYGIRTARNAIDQFGMLENDLVRTYGDEFKTNFVNVTDAAGQTLVSKVNELRKQAEQYKEPEQPKEPEKPATTVVANGNILKDEKGNFVYEDKNTGNLVYVENPKASGSASMPVQGTVSTNQSESADEIWGPQTSKRAEQAEQRDKVLADLDKYEHALEMSSKFNQTISDARAYGDELWRDQRGKENKLNDEKTLAERQYNYLQYRTFEQLQPLNELEKELASDPAFTGNKDLEAQRSGWMSEIAQVRDKVTENMHKSFTNGIMLDAKQLEDDLTKEVNGFGLSKQKETLNKYDDRISQQQKGIAWMQDRLDKGLVDSNYQKQYEDAIKAANKNIANAQVARANLAAEYTTQNETAGRLALESLQIKQGLKSKNSLSVISAARKQEISALRKQVGNQYKEGQYSQEEYDRITAGLDQLESRANPAMIALGQGAKVLKTELKSTAGYLTNMFTRRLFQSAISETTNFVKQFDASMNTIQMITLKTDEQIATLGDTLIDKAKEMKVSVSEITQSAATLYRQGLNDQEVDERLGVISKFSKVSGTKVDAATKLITVAMNTGLVQNAETAADIVTALGDNAATNAAEIEKGIEKAGAAAAADGTSFAQLSAMLTAITSTTQIGGNVAGRTLNTIFGRMNKIGTNELIYDENGNAVSGSAVAKLLAEEGIRMYDEYGNKRSSFDTLYALSQKWEGLSDAKQQQFANAIAGTRQYSNFAAIMSGMAEGKVEEYLKLAGESEGITDKKYEIYTKSLNASLTDLRNTWDGLINDMTDSGALTGGLGFLTNFVQGIDKANESLGGLGVTLAGVLPSLMIMGGLKSGSLVGLGVAGVGGIIAAIVSAIGNQKSSEEQYQELIDDINDKYSLKNEEVEKARALFNKGDNRTEDEEKQYDRLLRNLSVTVESGDLETVNKQTDEQRRQNAENIIQQASEKNDISRVREFVRDRKKTNKLIEDEINKAVKEDEEDETNLGSRAMQTLFSGEYNAETMNERLKTSGNLEGYKKDQLTNLYNIISIQDSYKKILDDYNISNENLFNEFVSSWASGGMHQDFTEGSAIDALYKVMQDYWSRTYQPTTKVQTIAKENYKQYLTDMALPLEEDEIEALAEDLANRYVENGGDFIDYISDALNLSQDNYTIETITASARNHLKDIGYKKSEKAEKFENADLDYIQNGYYYDNKTGEYLTLEQAEAQIDRYNNQPRTRQVAAGYNILFNGQQIYSTKDENQNKDQLRKTVNAYKEAQRIVPSVLLQGDKVLALQEIRRNAIQDVKDERDRNFINADIKNALKANGFNYSEEYADSLVDLFTSEKLDFRDLFKGGALLDDNVLNSVKTVLSQYNIEYTGTLAEFLTSSAEKVFSSVTEYVEEAYQEYDMPDLKGIRNHFQAQSKTTYDTWKSKNQTAINATEVIGLINNNNLNSAQSLYDYMNREDVAMWDLLSADEELAPLLLGISRDQKTGKITAPETLMQDIMSRLYELSSEYGEKSLTSAEKVSRVQEAISNVGKGYYSSYSSMEAARDEAYKAWEDTYKEERDAAIGTKEDIGEGKRYAKEADFQAALATYTAAKPYLTNEEFISSVWGEKQTQFINAQDIALLQGYVGNNLANKILNKEALTDIESNYINGILTNAAYGGSGLSVLDRLNGANTLRNMSKEDAAKLIRENPEIVNEWLNGFSGAQEYLTALQSGDNEKAIQAYDNWYKEQSEKYNFKYTEDKNASKLLQNYMSWVDGSLTDRMSMVNPYIQQQRTLANAQNILNKGVSTEEDRNALASILGLEDQDIKELIGSDKGKQNLQKMLNDKTGKMIEEFAKSFGVDLKSADWANQLRSKILAEQPELYNSIDSLISSISDLIVDANGYVVSAEIKPQQITRAGDYYTQAEEDYEKQTRTTRAAGWIKQYKDEIDNVINSELEIYYDATGKHSRRRTYADALNIIAERNGLDPEIMAEYWNATRVGLNKAAPELLELYDNAQISGGKYKNQLNSALLKTLFGSNVSDTGKFDFGNIEEIKDQMIKATEDVDSGSFTVWSILASNFSELQNALQSFKDSDLQAGQRALEEFFKTFNSEHLNEILQYTEVSKEFKEALVDISKGGADASIGMLKLQNELNSQYNELAAMTNAKGKSGKKLSGQDRTYFMSATGLKKAELDNMSEAQISQLADATAQKKVKVIQDELVATVQSASEKIDFSKVQITSEGKLDLSEATKDLEGDIKEQWKNIQDILNKVVEDDYVDINFPVLFGLAGYDITGKNAEKLVDKKELENAKKILTSTLDQLYEIMTDEERSKLKFNTDLTIDTSNLKADQAKIVQQWNTYCKQNPLVASVALAAAGGDTVKAQSVIASGKYTSYNEAFQDLKNMSASELQTLYLADQVAVAMTGKKGYTTKASGGGKSAAQKALEAAQKAVKEPTHRAKMAESAEKTADEFNDVTSYSLAINNQYEAYKDLAEVYKKNIADLEATRKGLSEDSDEYDKLTDAIYQYQEALDGLSTKIAELNKKQIAFITKLQEYQDKLITFTGNIHSARGDLALAREEYPEYRSELLEQIRTKGMTYRQNISDLAQYKEELARVRAEEPEGSTNEQDLLEKIREIELEQLDLEKQSIDIWTEYLKNETAELEQRLTREAQPYQNTEAIQSLYTQIFGSREDYAAQRNSIATRRQAAVNLFDVYDRMIPELRKNLEDKDSSPEAKYEAQEALTKAEEGRLQAYQQIQSLDSDLISSILSEIETRFADILSPIQHQADISSAAGEIQRDTEQWNNYRGALQSQAEAYATLAEGASAKADVLREALAAINQVEQPELYRQTRDALYEQEKAQLQYVKTVIETTRQIQQSITEQTELAAQRSGIMPQSNANVAETLGKMYLGNYDYNSYRQQLDIREASANKLLLDSAQMVHFYEGRVQDETIRNDPKLLQENLENLAKWNEKSATLQSQLDAQRKERAQSYIDQIKQRAEDKLEDKQYTMGALQDYAARAQQNENFEMYRSIMQQEMEIAQQMIEVYTEAIRELEVRIAHMEQGTPEYNAAKKQLNEFKTSLRKAQITVAQAADEIQKSIIDELLKNFEAMLRGPKHTFDIASIYGNMYQGAKQYQDYRDMLAVQNEQRDRLTVILEQEIADLEAQLSSTYGTPQYDRVVEAIYQKETEKENLYAQSVETRRAIDNSVANELLESYQKEMGKYDRSISAYSLQANYYSANKDDQRYIDAVTKQKDAIKAKQEAEKANLQTMIDTAATLHTNTEGFEKLEQQIYASAQSIAEMDVELLNLEKTMQSMQVEELLERIGRVDTMDTHALSMISTELGRYENLGQLTNVNTLIDAENEAQAKRAEHLEVAIEDMKNLLDTMTEGSDEYWQLASSIMKYEEALSQTNATIEKNNKLQEENKKKILETRKAAEDAVVKEIEDRIKREREMLASTDNIQQKIINIIRERYKDEAEQIKKNLEKQKDALSQEKSLITERLNFRKKAMETENKQEELTQLQQQLALISGDSSRTKEAKELSKKITDLQRELTMSETENEVQAQADLLEDQIQAIDDDINFRQEKLNTFLEDANNFREEVDNLISGSFENLTAWIQENDKAYRNTLEAGEENMLRSWEDTWKKMNGIVDTYWEQVEQIMSSMESYVEFFSESQERALASETSGQELFDKRIKELYQNYLSSVIDDAEYTHTDQFAISRNKDELDELVMSILEGVTGLEPEKIKEYVAPTEYALNNPREENFSEPETEEETAFEKAVLDWGTANERIEEVIVRAIKEVAINNGAMSDELYANIYDSLNEYMTTSTDYAGQIQKTADDAITHFRNGEGELQSFLGASGAQFFAESTEALNANRQNILGLLSSLEQQSGLTLSELFGITTTGYDSQKELFHTMATDTEEKLKDTTDATGTALTNTALDAANAAKDFAEDFKVTEEGMYKGLVDTTTGFENEIDKTEKSLEASIANAAGQVIQAAIKIETSAGAMTSAAGTITSAGYAMESAAGTISQAGRSISSYVSSVSSEMSSFKSSVNSEISNIKSSISSSISEALKASDTSEQYASITTTPSTTTSTSSTKTDKDIFNEDTQLIDVAADVAKSTTARVISGTVSDAKGTSASTGTGGSTGGGTTTYAVYDEKGYKTNYTVEASSPEEAFQIAQDTIGSYYTAGTGVIKRYGVFGSGTGHYASEYSNGAYYSLEAAQSAANKLNNEAAAKAGAKINSNKTDKLVKSGKIAKNDNGGLIDYTGLAWVDGTFTKPESFLDAVDTKLLRDMLNAFNYVRVSPTMTHVDPSTYNNNTTIGDVNVTINQAELKSDADLDKVAKRVGEVFTKEIQKQGITLNAYAR